MAHAGARHAPNPTWIPSTASWLPFMIRCQSHTATHPPQPLVALVLLQVLAFHLFKILWTTSRALCLLSHVTLLLVSVLVASSLCVCTWVHLGATHPRVSWKIHFPDSVTTTSLPLQQLWCTDAVASLVVELCPLQVRRFISWRLDAANSQMHD